MKKEYHFWTYIVTNPDRDVMYTGMTNNLARRLQEHYDNRGEDKTFAGRYYCYNLVYYEYTNYVLNAIHREKEIKDMSRAKKIRMISEINPEWKFLNGEFIEGWTSDFQEGMAPKETSVAGVWWADLAEPPEGAGE